MGDGKAVDELSNACHRIRSHTDFDAIALDGYRGRRNAFLAPHHPERSGVPIIELSKVVLHLSKEQRSCDAPGPPSREVTACGRSLAERVGEEDNVIASLDHFAGIPGHRSARQLGTAIVLV
jgi:hypothetical protein